MKKITYFSKFVKKGFKRLKISKSWKPRMVILIFWLIGKSPRFVDPMEFW